jgi:transketolase
LRAFGHETREVAGHDEEAIDAALTALAAAPAGRPRALVARTVKGHGVSFMAADNRWHYTRLTAETYARAMAELAN